MAEGAPEWQSWLEKHGPAALLYARQITRSSQDAEDALHDGFVRFWRRREGAREPVALFYACVRTAALDQQRSGLRRRRREGQWAHPGASWAGQLDELARREIVSRALAHLPQEQCEVIVLKIWGGLTFAQVAQSLGVPGNTVAARYRYGMEKLSNLLSPEALHE